MVSDSNDKENMPNASEDTSQNVRGEEEVSPLRTLAMEADLEASTNTSTEDASQDLGAQSEITNNQPEDSQEQNNSALKLENNETALPADQADTAQNQTVEEDSLAPLTTNESDNLPEIGEPTDIGDLPGQPEQDESFDDDLGALSAIDGKELTDEDFMSSELSDGLELDMSMLDEQSGVRKSSGLKKFVAPLAVLVVAGAIGTVGMSFFGGDKSTTSMNTASTANRGAYNQGAQTPGNNNAQVASNSSSQSTNPVAIGSEPSLFEDEMDFAFDESMPPPPSEDDSQLDQGSNMGGEDEMAFTFDEPDETEFVAPEDDFSFDVAAIEDETESMTSSGTVSSDSFVASNEFESVDVINDAVSEAEEINIAQISDDSGFTDTLPDQDVMQVIESDTVIPPDSSQLTEYDQFSEATDDTGYEQYISDDFDSGFNDTSSDPIEDNALERGSDVYFDSELTQTPGELARQTGPRIIDPVKEPAQKWVNARLSSKAVDTEAVIVSAKRALKLRRYDAALEMYTALYEKNDKDPVVLMGLAVSQQNTGQIELAMQTYEKLLELDPDNHDAMVNMLGLLRKQFPEVALRRLINLYSQHPDKPGIAAQIGIVQADLGEFGEAMRYLAIASSIEPNNAQHVFNMAIVADKMGDRKAAVTYYQEALELDTIYGRGQSVPRKSIFDRLAVLRR